MSKTIFATTAVAIGALLPLGYMGSATALSATCNPGVQSIEEWNADKYRVKIRCSSIGRTTLVRGVLPISGESDSISPWFRETGKYYYGLYKNAWGWQLGSPKTEMTG